MHDADESDDDGDETHFKSLKKKDQTLFIDGNSHWHIHERVISNRRF